MRADFSFSFRFFSISHIIFFFFFVLIVFDVNNSIGTAKKEKKKEKEKENNNIIANRLFDAEFYLYFQRFKFSNNLESSLYSHQFQLSYVLFGWTV